MLLNNINDLKHSSEQAVIINVNTKLVTTLALMSALKYAGMPVLLIDCESTDGSVGHFTELMNKHGFDLLSAPLKKHGDSLDWLFENISSEKVLLIDSDLEILNSNILDMMRSFIDNEYVYGCGFIHNPHKLTDDVGSGRYVERMWIPLVMLKVSHIRNAIREGYSFADKIRYSNLAYRIFNSLTYRISNLSALRTHSSFLFKWKSSNLLKWFMQHLHGNKPYYAYSDTGAEIYQYLKHERELFFVGFPAELHGKFANHYHGVTRLMLGEDEAHGTKLTSIQSQVQQRLYDIYGLNLIE